MPSYEKVVKVVERLISRVLDVRPIKIFYLQVEESHRQTSDDETTICDICDTILDWQGKFLVFCVDGLARVHHCCLDLEACAKRAEKKFEDKRRKKLTIVEEVEELAKLPDEDIFTAPADKKG